MNANLNRIKSEVYDKCELKISKFQEELESKEYDACRFKLNKAQIISRSSKITPKKEGQFVTLWTRIEEGPIQPLSEAEDFDYLIVNIESETEGGQFVFPKAILIQKGILSSAKNEGKRAFRIYMPKEKKLNKLATKAQKWQADYFFPLVDTLDLDKVLKLYGLKPKA